MLPRLLTAYFGLVPLCALAWWVAILTSERARQLFFRPEDADWFRSFLIPDLVVYFCLPIAIAIERGRNGDARLLTACHLGGAVYATAFTASYFAITGVGAVGALLMLLSLPVPAYVVILKR